MILAFSFFTSRLFISPLYTDVILYAYFISLLILFVFGAHGFVMVYYYMKQRGQHSPQLPLIDTPVVTVQLPLYNELYSYRSFDRRGLYIGLSER